MLLRKKMTIVGLAATLVLGLATFGTVALAQQTGTSAQNPAAGVRQARRAGMRRGMRRREMGGRRRVLNQLNLTAEQKYLHKRYFCEALAFLNNLFFLKMNKTPPESILLQPV